MACPRRSSFILKSGRFQRYDGQGEETFRVQQDVATNLNRKSATASGCEPLLAHVGWESLLRVIFRS
jgi:hypothetical protein